MPHVKRLILLLAAILFALPTTYAQQGSAGEPPRAATLGGEGEAAVDVQADELEYLADEKTLVGRGHVVVQRGEDILTADYVSFKTDTEDAHARGNVIFKRKGTVWQGEEMTYNFKTERGDFGTFDAYVDPFYVHAKESKRTSPEEFVLRNVRISTCEGNSRQFYIKARRARILNETVIKARGVTFFLGGIPIFWVPAWTKTLKGDKTDIDMVPGYSSRMGAYLLSAYNYRLNAAMSASTHVDYRSKRGWAFGQDFKWGDPRLTYHGEFKSYYLDDESPFEHRGGKEVEELKDLVDNERHRLKLQDTRGLSDRDYLITAVNYLSDPAILEDFFDDEYRGGQPENRVSLIHRGDRYTAALELNKRLNDFYGNVDRMPEASLNVSRMPLGQSPIYYESANYASALERVYPEQSDEENYDAFRVDSRHMLFWPTRHFGFLNVIPRGGYRGTYYSKTIEQTTTTNLVTSTDTNGVESATNIVETLTKDQGADLRSVYELGLELSFKAFKVLNNQWISRTDQGLRHVFEPYALHTYIPEPSVLPEQLYQFDNVDRIDKRHDVKIGMRNKLQTKRRERVHDLVDLDIWSTYRIEREEEENEFSDVHFDTELRLAEWWMMDFDGTYDSYEGTVNRFNTELTFLAKNETRLGFEYRYQQDERDQLAVELALFPNSSWSLDAYGRYAFDRNEMEENAVFLEHRTRCLGIGFGYKQIYKEEAKDDVQFWLQIWLLAFPSSSVELGL